MNQAFKKYFPFFLFIGMSFSSLSLFSQVGISTASITPDPSSVLELRSTTLGFLPPRMTTTQRDAISTPATGLLVYNTTTSQLNYYTGSAWTVVGGGQAQLNGTGFVKASGTTITYDNSTYITSANVVFNNQANTYTAGMKQTMQGSSTTAGLNFGGVSSDPSSLSNGDVWHNTISNAIKYRVNGTTRTFANLDEAQTFTNKDFSSATNTFPVFGVINGGTGNNSYTIGDILYASGSTTLSKLPGVATGNALISGGTGTAPSWGKIGLTTHVSGTLPVANGGTGQSSALTQGGVVYGSSTTAMAVTAAGTSGQVLQSTGTTAPTWVDGGTMMFTGLSNGTAVNNTTSYFPIVGAMAAATTDATSSSRTLVSRTGTVSNLIVRISVALAAGKIGTVTVLKNGVATSLVATLSVGPLTFTDPTNTVSVVAGDELSVKITTTGNVKFSWAADFTY